jgi:hypothetical protein
MNWLTLLQNPEGIQHIFGYAPSLERANIVEVVLSPSALLLSFELKEFPEHPPEKWIAQKHTLVQLQFRCFGAVKLELNSSVATNGIADLILLKGEDGLIHLKTDNSGLHIKAVFEYLYLSKILAYAVWDSDDRE